MSEFFMVMRPTGEFVVLNGVVCRRWIGSIPPGRLVDVFVQRIGTADPAAQAVLDAVLTPMPAPPEASGAPIAAGASIEFPPRYTLTPGVN
jgi:hypothetical protein